MNEDQALSAFAALSQETRLQIVRLLVRSGPEGMAAGAIGEALGGATTSRLSFHLTHLEHADPLPARGALHHLQRRLPGLGGACRLPDARLLPRPPRNLRPRRRRARLRL